MTTKSRIINIQTNPEDSSLSLRLHARFGNIEVEKSNDERLILNFESTCASESDCKLALNQLVAGSILRQSDNLSTVSYNYSTSTLENRTAEQIKYFENNKVIYSGIDKFTGEMIYQFEKTKSPVKLNVRAQIPKSIWNLHLTVRNDLGDICLNGLELGRLYKKEPSQWNLLDLQNGKVLRKSENYENFDKSVHQENYAHAYNGNIQITKSSVDKEGLYFISDTGDLSLYELDINDGTISGDIGGEVYIRDLEMLNQEKASYIRGKSFSISKLTVPLIKLVTLSEKQIIILDEGYKKNKNDVTHGKHYSESYRLKGSSRNKALPLTLFTTSNDSSININNI